MPSVLLANFGGIVPRYNRALPGVPAVVAENVKLWHGTLAPWREPLDEAVALGSTCARTIFRYGCCWLAWDDCCVSATGGLPDCPRVFVTGWKRFGYPVSALLPADGSCDFDWKRLGVPKPSPIVSWTIPPLEAPAGAPIAGVQIKRATRNYVVTYVNSFGEEGAPSDPISVDLDADEGASVSVTIPGAPLASGWDVVAARLYRVGTGFDTTGTGDHFGEFFFVEEVAIGAADVTVTDAVRSDLAAEPIQTRYFMPPPDDLCGIVALPEGQLAGFVGQTLWISEPWNFHAWACSHDLDDNIVALTYSAGLLYVATDGHPYFVSPKPGAARCDREISRYSEALPCVSAKSMASTPTGAIFASRDGLVRMIGNAGQIDTHQFMAEDDWLSILPHTMIGTVHDGRYFAFTNRRGYIFDFTDGIYSDAGTSNKGQYSTLTLTPTALYRTRDDLLFMSFPQREGMAGSLIARWDAGAAYMPYRWRSALTVSQGHINFAASKVVLEDYPWPAQAGVDLTFSLIADERKIYGRSLRHSRGFRLPHGCRHFDFQIEITGTIEVRNIHFATSMHELAEAK